MSIQSEVSRNDYIGNGATATYSYGFRIYAATDLLVTQVDTVGLETTLTYLTDYTVAGVDSFNGGTITLTAGNLPSGYGLTLRFKTTLTQGVKLRNQSSLFLSVTEDALDRLTRIDQQQQDEVDRAIKLPETEPGTLTLPTLAVRASKNLACDAEGNIIASSGSGTVPISTFMETVVDDTTAAAARATLGAADDTAVVHTTGNETVAGVKAFTGANTHTGDETHSGIEVFSNRINLTGGKLSFPATQVPSADPNTIDDYKEGTWTPSVGGSATYNAVNRGYYVKTGKKIHITGLLSVASIGTGGVSLISGMPGLLEDVVAGISPYGGAVHYYAGVATSVYNVALTVEDAGSGVPRIRLYGCVTAGSNLISGLTLINNGTVISFSATYYVQ